MEPETKDISHMLEISLAAQDLACVRGGHPVFDRLDFTLSPGEALIVKGPNGAGKSSLLMVLAGLIAPAAGLLRFDGRDPEAAPGSHIHYLGHRGGIKPGLTVRENLSFWSDLYGGDEGLVKKALESAGLAGLSNLDAGVLSAGQTRRLALARLLAVPRPVWLLDEPTSALDTGGGDWVASALGAHLDGGGLAVIATHLPIGIEARPGIKALGLGAIAEAGV